MKTGDIKVGLSTLSALNDEIAENRARIENLEKGKSKPKSEPKVQKVTVKRRKAKSK